ncbi:hypothetical protein CTEN210_17616 [Chaetoceros tenuissimus]|uniref:HSF-type DNA-binding domain-containing protein n=1 Tax=Chaetoceros tenuissimus TaxID=426638 RepID=A0AAD3DD24_9STRA|nr:hypothetical protein CTEN210_17616 [Chaetoceros tenuissimus]
MRMYVDHHYNDLANSPLHSISLKEKEALKSYFKEEIIGAFPSKLQTLLRIVEKHDLDHIVSWQPHGRSFLIHDTNKFEDVIMRKYFNKAQIASFRRQLNLYNFKRITRGPDAGSYYHEGFLRGRPVLACRIQRIKVKGTKFRATSCPEDEPDFYKMSVLPGVDEVDPPSSNEDGEEEEKEEEVKSKGDEEKSTKSGTLQAVSAKGFSTIVPTASVPGVACKGRNRKSSLSYMDPKNSLQRIEISRVGSRSKQIPLTSPKHSQDYPKTFLDDTILFRRERNETVYDAARCYEEGYIQAKLDMLHMLRQRELRNSSPQETFKGLLSSDFSKCN